MTLTLLRKYNVLNFDNLILYSYNGYLVFKITHNAPPPLKKTVQLFSEQMTRALRSILSGECRIPKRSSGFAQSAFSFKAIREWNNPPAILKTCADFSLFSCDVKKWILGNQACEH